MGATARPTRNLLPASTSTPPSGSRAGEATGFAVDPTGDPAGQLDEVDGAVSGDVEQGVVRLERVVGDRHGDPRGAPDHVASGRQVDDRAGAGTGLADDGHDGGDGLDGVAGARRRRTWVGDETVGRRRRRPESTAVDDAGSRQAHVAGDGPAVEPQRESGIDTEDVRQVTDPIIGGAGGHGHAPTGWALDVDSGDGRGAHALPGRDSQRKTERRSRHGR